MGMSDSSQLPSLTEDLLRLYELALSVGQKSGADETARHFTKILTERYNLTGASIWWKQTEYSGFQALSVLPRKLLRHDTAPDHDFLAQLAGEQGPIQLSPGNAEHRRLDQFFEVNNQYLAVFPIPHGGILFMWAALASIFSARMLNGLRPVIDNLGNAISGAMAHQQLRRSEADLNHQRGFLKTLVQTLPDLIWLKDPEGVYLACNSRF